VDWLSGAAIMVRASVYDAVGGFDEGFAHGIEDADLCRRLRSEGWRVVAVPGPPVVHAKGTSGHRSGDPERVEKALVAGLDGWCRYSRRYHGQIRRRLQQAALLSFVALRLAYLQLRALQRGAESKGSIAAYRSAGAHLLHADW
jgi:GT2 family glycosyltransferase